ncbi:hypothetical protein Glove_139g398 [Diversispora epigaea]|uniref:Uncharacterized protein n=1 Tax=Diversispora epigaea TaxID=1348612 RepID=A0A397IVI0_9GLOM|nr:hypothetical protein Glove_139g398 [Diversispora epigaea]
MVFVIKQLDDKMKYDERRKIIMNIASKSEKRKAMVIDNKFTPQLVDLWDKCFGSPI